MTLASGQMLAHYRLLEKIGEGGMGVVWKAMDTTLARDVAIKILPDAFAKDAERVARFEREARLLASLTHPAIAAIYGLHVAGDVRFLAMELVPGEDLARRLTRGPMAVDEVIRIGKGVTEALEAAHENGVVHRDLKPANVVITPAGDVKVLDFGLAKAFEAPAAVSPRSSLSPTITALGTVEGVILGTAAYMSPEQARGRAVDKRADVWSCGCILYEALTAKRPFEGETVSDTLAAVLKLEPDWNALPASTPRALVDLTRRCLTKDPKERLRDIGEARIILGALEKGAPEAAAGSQAGALPHGRGARRSTILPWTLAAAFAALAVTAIVSLRTGEETSPQVMRLVSEQDAVVPNSRGAPFVLSADGARLVYVSPESDATGFGLVVREMDQTTGRRLAGTSGAEHPFLSPDGRSVGFFTEGRLKKMSLIGGTPVNLTGVAENRGGFWGPDDFIYYTPNVTDAIFRIPAAGGKIEQVTTLDAARNERSHRFPVILPGGKAILFAIGYLGFGFERASIGIQSLDAPSHEILIESGIWPRYLPTGHLAYVNAATLFVVPFDIDNLKITGEAVPLLEGVLWQTGTGMAAFDVSANGTLVYLKGEIVDKRHLLRVSRKGEIAPVSDQPQPWAYPRFTPDGRRIVVEIEGSPHDIWVLDVERGTLGRLTFEGDAHLPIVSPDGLSIVYDATSREGGGGIFIRRLDGTGQETRLTTYGKGRQRALGFTPDGRTLLFSDVAPGGSGADILALAMEGDPTPVPVLSEKHEECGARISPDGKWNAYVSTESGRAEIYMRTYPDSGGKWQISSDGGRMPVWSRDGAELFYVAGNTLMVVGIGTAPVLSAGKPKPLFEGNYFPLDRGTTYDVAPDGKSFVVVSLGDAGQRPMINMVVNWLEEVRRATAATAER